MAKIATRAAAVAVTAGLLLGAAPLSAQELAVEGPVPTTVLVHVESKDQQATLNAQNLTLKVDRHPTPIMAVMPVLPRNTQLAILIDDGLRGSFGLQMKPLADFINGLPAGVQVMVGYMENGTVRAKGGFTTNHEEVASQLHLTLSSPGINASPYFCLTDFVQHWPSNQPAARVVLMITNGVDPYNGMPTVMNQNSPYVEHAQTEAQRAGVAVYSIYYADAGMRRGAFSGQGYLAQVAEATGGQTYNQGTITPPSLAPYLKEFQRALSDSYAVTFQANATHENAKTLTPIQMKSTEHGLKVYAPDSVHPGVRE